MAKEENKGQGKSINKLPKPGSFGQIGEKSANQEKLRKAMEVAPRPKPKGDGGNGKKQNSLNFLKMRSSNSPLPTYNQYLNDLKLKGSEHLKAIAKQMQTPDKEFQPDRGFQSVELNDTCLKFSILGQECFMRIKVEPSLLIKSKKAFLATSFYSKRDDEEIEVLSTNFDKLGNINGGDVEDFFMQFEINILKQLEEKNLAVYL